MQGGSVEDNVERQLNQMMSRCAILEQRVPDEMNEIKRHAQEIRRLIYPEDVHAYRLGDMRLGAAAAGAWASGPPPPQTASAAAEQWISGSASAGPGDQEAKGDGAAAAAAAGPKPPPPSSGCATRPKAPPVPTKAPPTLSQASPAAGIPPFKAAPATLLARVPPGGTGGAGDQEPFWLAPPQPSPPPSPRMNQAVPDAQTQHVAQQVWGPAPTPQPQQAWQPPPPPPLFQAVPDAQTQQAWGPIPTLQPQQASQQLVQQSWQLPAQQPAQQAWQMPCQPGAHVVSMMQQQMCMPDGTHMMRTTQQIAIPAQPCSVFPSFDRQPPWPCTEYLVVNPRWRRVK